MTNWQHPIQQQSTLKTANDVCCSNYSNPNRDIQVIPSEIILATVVVDYSYICLVAASEAQIDDVLMLQKDEHSGMCPNAQTVYLVFGCAF